MSFNSKIHAALGLDNVCGLDEKGKGFIMVGGAPLPTTTYEYFRSLDIILCNSYGATETTCPITANLQGTMHRPGTVGKRGTGAWSDINEPDLNGAGEIIAGSRNIFMGYHNDPEKTKESFTENFMFKTGDQACLDEDGFVKITGRFKELIITSGGKNIAPVPIEEKIKLALGELVSNAVVIGDNQKYLTVLLTFRTVPDPQTQEPTKELSKSARSWIKAIVGSKLGRDIKTTEDFMLSPHVDRLTAAIWKGIESANSKSNHNVEVVQKFSILPQELTVSGGELSPSLKVKRFFVAQKYEGLIGAMYGNNECLNGCANVTSAADQPRLKGEQEEF